MNLLANLGSSLLWLLLTLLYQLTLFCLHRSLSLLGFHLKYLDALEREAFFNMSIRLLLEGALNFMICSTLNIMYQWDVKTNSTETISSIMSVGLLAALMGMVIMGVIRNC
jgi:hypothetical protein